jgi:hypothetical protein
MQAPDDPPQLKISKSQGPWRHLVTRYSSYPWYGRVFIAFSAMAFGINLLIPVSGTVGEALQPTIGGLLTSFCLIMVAQVLVTHHGPFGRRQVLLVYALLCMALVYAVFDHWVGARSGDSNNPWLRHSPWRPWWTFGLPILSAVILSLGSMRRAMQDSGAA